MSSNSPVSRTSPMIIRLFSSPVKQDSTAINSKIDTAESIPDTSRLGLKRKQTEKSEITNVDTDVKSHKNAERSSLVEKSSELSLRKISRKALRLDSRVSSEFESHVKQIDKNLSCPVAQTKEVDMPIMHSTTKPSSKQPTILLSNAKKGKSVSTSVVKITNAKLSSELSKFKNKLVKLPSKKLQTKNKEKITMLPTVSIYEPVTSYSIASNNIRKVVDKRNQFNISNEKPIKHCIQALPLEHSANMFSEITVNVKDDIDAKITTVDVGELPLQGITGNISNSSNVPFSIPLLESVKKEPEFLPPTITQSSCDSPKVDEPILPILSFRLLPEVDSDIDRNVIPLSSIKVEKSDELNETELLIEQENLQLSMKEETVQKFENECSNHNTRAFEVIVETSSIVQPSVPITQEVNLCRDIFKIELPSETTVSAIHEIESSTSVEDSKQDLVSQLYPCSLFEKTETIEFPSPKTLNCLANNLDTKFDENLVLPEVNMDTQSPKGKSKCDNSKKEKSKCDNSKKEKSKCDNSKKEKSKCDNSKKEKSKCDNSKKEKSKCDSSKKRKSKCDNSKNDSDVPSEAPSTHLLQLMSSPSKSKTIYGNEFEALEDCQEELNWKDCNAGTSVSTERDLTVNPPVVTDKFKTRGSIVENKSKKRQYRTHASRSPHLAADGQGEEDELVENSEASIAVEQPDLSMNEPVIIEDDVSDLEINELEQIRELLRQQLSQDNEDSDTLDSTNGINPTTVEEPQVPTDIESELGEKHSVATSEKSSTSSEATVTKSCSIPDDKSKECPVTASKEDERSPKKVNSLNGSTSKRCEPIEKQVPEGLEKTDLSNITRKRSLEKDESSCENTHNDQVSIEAEQDPVTDKPPLVMQSSNLLFNYGLDNRHGGGGSETTVLDIDELCPRKKLKLDFADDDLENVDNCNSQKSSPDVQTLNDQLSRDEQPLIQCEDSSSNPALDYQDSDQNDLMEFDILDEFESDGNDPEDNDDSDTSSDEGFDLDEIDAMLDEKLQERMKKDKNILKGADTEHEEKEKIVLKARGKNHFDLLPEGWIEVTHNSGMPIYLHKASRVCSMSKPYFLGPGSTRKHEIPMSAIPCLHYLKEKEKEKLNKNDEAIPQNTATANSVVVSSVNGEVETMNEEMDTSTTNREVDTSTANGKVDTSTANGKVDTSTANGKVDTSTANGKVVTSITNGEVDTSTANEKVVTLITNGEVDTTTANGQVVTSTTNGEVGSSSILLDDVGSVAEKDCVSTIFPSAKLESAKDTKESGSLKQDPWPPDLIFLLIKFVELSFVDYLAVREYCAKRFDFTRITVKRFRTWSGRRKHIKDQKHSQRPFLPDNTKLITCPLYAANEKSTNAGVPLPKREFIMNPSGKSPVCILHEYVQHTLRLQPKYVFKELENASTPYGAVVVINGIEYGCGLGSSKKSAKSDAARSALEILIPKMKVLSKEENKEEQDVEFFDQVRIEDPRICDLSVKAGQPYPYQILLECIKRNYGMGETTITCKMNNIKHQKNEFHMTCGKHEASVVCKNKRDGKHRASQAILQKLHPHINSWGSLLRMYGKGSCKTMKEKKEEEQQITELQSKATANKPNLSILSKLKDEMLKYREKVKSKKPIGKLIPESMEFPSPSSSNLKNVEL